MQQQANESMKARQYVRYRHKIEVNVRSRDGRGREDEVYHPLLLPLLLPHVMSSHLRPDETRRLTGSPPHPIAPPPNNAVARPVWCLVPVLQKCGRSNRRQAERGE